MICMATPLVSFRLEIHFLMVFLALSVFHSSGTCLFVIAVTYPNTELNSTEVDSIEENIKPDLQKSEWDCNPVHHQPAKALHLEWQTFRNVGPVQARCLEYRQLFAARRHRPHYPQQWCSAHRKKPILSLNRRIVLVAYFWKWKQIVISPNIQISIHYFTTHAPS